MENQYNIRHAREILEPCGSLKNYLRFDERGVWPSVERDPLLLSETEGLRWRPARELQHLPGAPEVNDTPTLPNPFNARELAAFMLEGVGATVADFYGDWSDGPDPDSLSGIDPDSRSRQAVIEAYDAYRLAIEKVGKWDADALARRDSAHKAYWGGNNDKVLFKAFEDAETEWDAAHQAWLTAMVVCLLEKPQATTEAPAAARDKARRDLLAPAIEAAQKLCENQFDASAVYAAMMQMAEDGKRPLLGLTDEGIKWSDANDEPQFLSLGNLRDRLRRIRKKLL